MENYEELFAVCLDGNLGDGIGFDFLEPARQFESIYIYIYHILYIFRESEESSQRKMGKSD